MTAPTVGGFGCLSGSLIRPTDCEVGWTDAIGEICCVDDKDDTDDKSETADETEDEDDKDDTDEDDTDDTDEDDKDASLGQTPPAVNASGHIGRRCDAPCCVGGCWKWQLRLGQPAGVSHL